MAGFFVALEGGEGVGKSTQCRLLAAELTGRGFDVVQTREPGGTSMGESVRDLLLGLGGEPVGARAEALLFAAARAEHVERVIRPALDRGDFVLSDRFVDSSIAYQGAGRSLGEGAIADLSDWASAGLRPDLTVLLDLAPEVGVKRARDANRMEQEPLHFHEKVRGAFLQQAERESLTHVVIPAAGAPDEVCAKILTELLPRLPIGSGA